jgi:hypothetical protein
MYIFDERDRIIEEHQAEIHKLTEEKNDQNESMIKMKEEKNDLKQNMMSMKEMALQLHTRVSYHIASKRRSVYGKKQFNRKRRYVESACMHACMYMYACMFVFMYVLVGPIRTTPE